MEGSEKEVAFAKVSYLSRFVCVLLQLLSVLANCQDLRAKVRFEDLNGFQGVLWVQNGRRSHSEYFRSVLTFLKEIGHDHVVGVLTTSVMAFVKYQNRYLLMFSN